MYHKYNFKYKFVVCAWLCESIIDQEFIMCTKWVNELYAVKMVVSKILYCMVSSIVYIMNIVRSLE